MSLGGHLASLTNMDKVDFVLSLTGHISGWENAVFMGYNDNDNEGECICAHPLLTGMSNSLICSKDSLRKLVFSIVSTRDSSPNQPYHNFGASKLVARRF